MYVLNLRTYQGRTPKFLRRYSDVAVVMQRLNQVTYKVKCSRWRDKERIVQVDKLKVRRRAAEKMVGTEGLKGNNPPH